MAKFKVGDKVRILDGSKIERYTGGWATICGMHEHVGEVHTIRWVDDDWGDGRVSYGLNGVGYWWDERGLEAVCKFKVGDKVKAKAHDPYGITTNGWTGTVTKVYPDEREDIWVAGPEFSGHEGVPVESKYFDLVPNEQQKIVITTDGKTTTATLYDDKQRIKDAKAVCAPNDEFDFNKGASIALERLTGQKAEPEEEDVPDFLKALAAIAAFSKFIKDELDD